VPDTRTTDSPDQMTQDQMTPDQMTQGQMTQGQSSQGRTTQGPVSHDQPKGVPGYRNDKDAVLRRLKRVEGQVRGLQRMVEADEYCIDVLTQVAAATKALQGVAVQLLDDHLRHCVNGAVAEGPDGRADELVTEATRAVERLLRS
jgi:CsoR family transcriptional regulator, copper-sensing transcriptional repressor